MFPGKQFVAPQGFGSFRQGVRYYFAGDRPDGSVLIVWFEKVKSNWRVFLMTPKRTNFEDWLVGPTPKIVILQHQFSLPPWLEDAEGIEFDEIEDRRYTKKKQTYRQQAESRLQAIMPAMGMAEKIIKADRPLKAIAAATKGHESKQNANRLKLWFFAFTLHAENLWALKQPTHAMGSWNRRAEKHIGKKFGRPSLQGATWGWSAVSLREKIIKSYDKRSGEGVTMVTIHTRALLAEFGCIVIKDSNGNDTYIHPQNDPFPTYGQFRSVVIKHYGLAKVQLKIYGAARIRAKAKSEKGFLSAPYMNLLESVHVDAYYTTEIPQAKHSNHAAARLAVAEAICATSGACVGIGFSLESETGEAYRSMLFCMCVDKTYIAKLYGISVGKLNWVMKGLPPTFTSDRGPAGHRNLAIELEEQFPIKSITPSYSGQTNAFVEANHPREVQLAGAPSYVQSELDVIQMMKHEVLRACSTNHSKDISGRLRDEDIIQFSKEGLVSTPHHYWTYLENRCRTSARSLSLEQAVRAFWTPTTFKTDRYGIAHRHRSYKSNEFLESAFYRRCQGAGPVTVNGYMLSLIVRYIFVEVDGRLMELEPSLKTRTGDDSFEVTLSDLNEVEKTLATLKSRTRAAASAARGRFAQDCLEETGEMPNDGIRRRGKPKKTGAATSLETRVAKGPLKIRRVA